MLKATKNKKTTSPCTIKGGNKPMCDVWKTQEEDVNPNPLCK